MVIVVWMLYLQLPVQSLPSTTKVVCLFPTDGKMTFRRSMVFSG